MKPMQRRPELAHINPQSTRETDQSSSALSPLKTLWAGKWVILLCLCVAIAGASYYANRVLVPVYTSTAVLIVEAAEEQVVDLNSVVSGLASADSAAINSEVEVLRSRSLLGKVVDQLDLTSDPEFNPHLRDLGLKTRIKNMVAERVGLPLKERTIPDESVVRSDTVSQLRRVVRARNLSSTLVFNISVTSQDRHKASLIANTLSEIYIRNQIDVKFQATSRATSWLSNRVTELRDELVEAERNVKEFSASIELVSAEGLLSQELQLKELRERIANLEENAVSSRQRMQDMQAATTRDEKAQASGDRQLVALLTRIDDPSVATLFDTSFDTLLARTSLEAARAEDQIKTLRVAYDAQEKRVRKQSQDLIRLEQLSRDAEANGLLYEHFLTRLKETSAQEGIHQSDSRILSEAVTPKSPSAPDTGLIIAMWSIIGALIGAGLVVLRSYLSDTFLTVRQLEEITRCSVIAAIPRIPGRRRVDVPKYLIENPISAAAESVRNLRTSIMLSNMEADPKIISVTSSLPGEGKTTVSLALAYHYANLGKKTLLIEGDMRRRVLEQYFDYEEGAKGKDGILAAMLENEPLEKLVQSPEQYGFDVLHADNVGTNPADLFASKAFANLIEKLRSVYDYVIIDTPPILVVPDSRLIVQHCDYSLLVVAWNRTLRSQIKESLRLFEQSNQGLPGLVFNSIDDRKLKRYGYGESYGAYSYSGRKYYSS